MPDDDSFQKSGHDFLWGLVPGIPLVLALMSPAFEIPAWHRNPGCVILIDDDMPRNVAPVLNPGTPVVVDGTVVREVCIDGLAWLSQKDANGGNVLTQILVPGRHDAATPKTCR